MASWRWVDELREVLRDLGGRANLKDIEARIRERGRKPPNPTLGSTVRSYLQYYSSDSETYWGKGDFFHLVERGAGIWELRAYPFNEATAEEEYVEGRRRLRLHASTERNARAVRQKKKRVLMQTGRLACEVCDFDFLLAYGPLGEGFAECHHRTPLAELEEDHKTRLDELAVVCANCHRMLHRSGRGGSMLSVERLRQVVLAKRTVFKQP